MEEKQIVDFVQRVFRDETLRTQLSENADGVIAQEQLSPRVASVIKSLVPHLQLNNRDESFDIFPNYWRP